ncbi:MAG: transglutaminase family protein [Bacteroidia bacterium]|nr:transglutaminase family protein [Bacteroidia bacterium]MCZ2249660.1 transglutaminase-like domain-containing protein [Bacteroidia bacterium]
MNNNELNALISLLDDPDESIFRQVNEKILAEGVNTIVDLENAWENSKSILQQQRIENLIQKIQFQQTQSKLKSWIESGGKNLLEGALIISKYQFPDLNENKINKYIEQLVQDVWIELTPHLTALEQVKIFNHILFEVHGFSGNNSDFHNPNNSFINIVMESKKGNPLSISLLYMLVARQLNVPVYGVNLPQHFVLAFVSEDNNEVLFYINAFSRGVIFNRAEITTYLNHLKLAPNDNYFYPCSHVEIIKRMVNNLIFSFDKFGAKQKVKDMKQLMQLFNI